MRARLSAKWRSLSSEDVLVAKSANDLWMCFFMCINQTCNPLHNSRLTIHISTDRPCLRFGYSNTSCGSKLKDCTALRWALQTSQTVYHSKEPINSGSRSTNRRRTATHRTNIDILQYRELNHITIDMRLQPLYSVVSYMNCTWTTPWM